MTKRAIVRNDTSKLSVGYYAPSDKVREQLTKGMAFKASPIVWSCPGRVKEPPYRDPVPMVMLSIILGCIAVIGLLFADMHYRVTGMQFPLRLFIVTACGSCSGSLVVALIARLITRAA